MINYCNLDIYFHSVNLKQATKTCQIFSQIYIYIRCYFSQKFKFELKSKQSPLLIENSFYFLFKLQIVNSKMKGIMFQKSQKILEFEQKHQKLQEELKKVLQQFQQIEHQLAQVAQSQSKNSNKIEIFSLDKKMIQHELKAQSNQQEKLQIQIKELQAVMKINQQKSVKKQEQLYQLSKKDEQLSQRVSRLKQEYKMYLTIGQSQSNIVNLAQKLQRQKKTSERMLEILLNKQKARVKYFNVITSKRQKSEQVNLQRVQNMGKNKDPFKLPISLSPTAASFKNSKFDKKAAFFSQQNGQKRQKGQKGQKKITETEKYNNVKKYDELIRKKNMILNKK